MKQEALELDLPQQALPKTQSRKPSMETISLFSGAGGLDLGLEAVGFKSLFLTDVDEHSCKTLSNAKIESKRRRKPFLREAVIIESDIRETTGCQILESINKSSKDITLLAGGPPCQAFSVFGQRKGRSDPRGQLSFEYLNILADIRPEIFLFENVYGLLTIEKGEIFKELCERLSSPRKGLSYTLSVLRTNAYNFGVPQHRDRVFIIGHRYGRKINEIEPLFGPGTAKRHRQVSDALCGLPKLGAEYPANHYGRKHSERIISRYASMGPGDRDVHTRINKLDLSRPSYTIIVGSDAGGGKGHIHPIEPREVSPRESARIQTFPDWWSFSGTSRHPIRQVGNAVPPLLAAAIGNRIRKDILGLREVSFKRIVDLLDQQHLFNEDD